MQRYMQMLLVLLLVSCAHANTQDIALDFKEVAEGVYVHYGQHLDIDEGYHGDICNISFVVGRNGVAVIDTGGSFRVGKQMREAIKKVTNQPVRYVINTHVHPDHIYGNAAFLEDKPQFVGHAKLAAAMQLREEAYTRLNNKLLGADAKDTVIVLPDLAVDQALSLDLGDRSLQVTAYANAHTNTDVTVMDNKTGTLFTGDLLFIERTPVVEGDIKGLIAAIETLKSYPAKQVVPGHGPTTQAWVQALENAQRYLNVMLADIRTAIKNGDSMEQTMSTAAASERNKWVLFDVANRRNVNMVFPALEWE